MSVPPQDAKGQLDTLTARLAATDKALSDANTRAASLNGQLVLTESETRLKTQELLARVQAAEDGERLAKVRGLVLDRASSRMLGCLLAACCADGTVRLPGIPNGVWCGYCGAVPGPTHTTCRLCTGPACLSIRLGDSARWVA